MSLLVRLISSLGFYTAHAWRETYRVPGQIRPIVMIVCGVVVPLALLLGLTDGLIRQQEDDFRKNSSANEIAISVTSSSRPLTPTVVAELQRLPGVAGVIEDITKVVTLRVPGSDLLISGVTARSTAEGDPLLRFYHCEPPSAERPEILLSQEAADRLQIPCFRRDDQLLVSDPPPRLTLEISRQEGLDSIATSIEVSVRGVLPLGSTPLVFLHRDWMDDIESYQQGRPVPRRGWAGTVRPAVIGHEAYITFSKAPLTDLDRTKLKANGLAARLLEPSDKQDADRLFLSGLLKGHTLHVYELTAEGADPAATEPHRLTRPADEIERITEIDDVVVPWTAPLTVTQQGIEVRYVGLTLRRRWLKQFFAEQATTFSDQDSLLSARWDSPQGVSVPASCDVPLSDGQTVSLAIVTTGVMTPAAPSSLSPSPASAWDVLVRQLFPQGSSTAQTVTVAKPLSVQQVVVPAPLLAALQAERRGEVSFDRSTGHFVPLVSDNAYYQGRVIAATIHDVPLVDAALQKLGYATQSQRTRVEELRRYAQTLDLLVRIVGGTVAFFGFWTLTTALVDNVQRKQRTIGILKQRGVGALGVFYIVLVRGLFIGLVAALWTVGLSSVGAWLLTEYLAACLVTPRHLQAVGLFSAAACLIGAVIPAIRAATISPEVLVREGQLA